MPADAVLSIQQCTDENSSSFDAQLCFDTAVHCKAWPTAFMNPIAMGWKFWFRMQVVLLFHS